MEVVPYVEGKYNARVQSLVTVTGTENFLAWNSGIDLGLDFRVGSVLTFLGFKKEFGPEVLAGNVWPIWSMPSDITLTSTLAAETAPGKVIPLKFKVTTSAGAAVNLCPIYVNGNGTFSKQVVFTNTSGEATLDWTVGTTPGDNSFTATIYNADKSVIKELTKTVKVADGTGGTGTLFYDGRTYKTVIINGKEWMAENLAYLPSVSPPSAGSNTAPYYYVYGYAGTDVAAAEATANYNTYGVLYNWPATLAACPPGWHLPSDAEWTALTTFLGGESVAGGKLKETGTSHWNSPNAGATNEYGFAALPAGGRDYSGTFQTIGSYVSWWSSTENSTYYTTWYRYMYYNNSRIIRSNNYKEYGYSVRCVRD